MPRRRNDQPERKSACTAYAEIRLIHGGRMGKKPKRSIRLAGLVLWSTLKAPVIFTTLRVSHQTSSQNAMAKGTIWDIVPHEQILHTIDQRILICNQMLNGRRDFASGRLCYAMLKLAADQSVGGGIICAQRDPNQTGCPDRIGFNPHKHHSGQLAQSISASGPRLHARRRNYIRPA
jgi:hypothetical protein